MDADFVGEASLTPIQITRFSEGSSTWAIRDDVGTRPVHLKLIQDVVYLEGDIILPQLGSSCSPTILSSLARGMPPGLRGVSKEYPCEQSGAD